MIIITVIVVFGFCIDGLVHNGPGEGLTPFNTSDYWTMVGFAVYTYEGIGVIMPIMNTCAVPDQFPKILVAAIAFLVFLYIAFGNLCYITFGANMTSSMVLLELPANNAIVMIVKLLFMSNLIAGYPLIMFPFSTILESFTLKKSFFKPKS